MTTLVDVHSALAKGEYRTAFEELEVLLKTEPSADAWYLAAELTLDKDRDRAIRHLKRALLMDPRHGDTLTLLGQLGEARDFTMNDVAEEVVDVVASGTDNTPLLRRVPRRLRLVVVAVATLLIVLVVMVSIPRMIPYNGPAYIPEAAPRAAAQTVLEPGPVFAGFVNSEIDLIGLQRVKERDREILKFSVAGGADGGSQPVQIIVYHSISDLVRDSAGHRSMETHSIIVANVNAMLVYSKGLQGTVMENRLVQQFQVITGA